MKFKQIHWLLVLLVVIVFVAVVYGSSFQDAPSQDPLESEITPVASLRNATGTTSSVAFSATRTAAKSPPVPKPVDRGTLASLVAPVSFKTITLGLVANKSELSEDREEHEPLVRYLAKKLAGGEANGKLIISESAIEQAERMRRGEIDLFIDTPFTSAVMQKLAGATLFAARAKGGADTYRSYIFVKKDSGITKLSELSGKKIAFESPDSTSNYFLPRVELKRAGLTVAPIPKDGNIPQGTVGYYFTGDDAIIIPDVLRGKAVAGGRNSVSYIKETATTGGKLRILAQTPKVYRSVVVASRKLTEGQVSAILQTLIAMDTSDEGRKVLLKSGKTLYFRAVSPADAEFGFMQQMASEIDAEIIAAVGADE